MPTENSVLRKMFKIHYATWQIFVHSVLYFEQHLHKPFSGSKDGKRKIFVEEFQQDGRIRAMEKKYGKKRERQF
jgi:hypothetical protein